MSNKKLSDAYRDYEDCEHGKLLKERDELITREENFQREQLERKLKSIDNLANSLLILATSLTEKCNNNAPIINIYIDKDISPEKLEIVLNKIGVV